GYHGYFVNGDSEYLYANMPYTSSTSGCTVPTAPNDYDADSTINVTSHELMETVSDPDLGGWYDVDDNGGEIGDKCAWQFGATDAQGADVTISGHPYIVQKEWSNAKSNGQAYSGCALKYLPTPTPTATRTATATPTRTPTRMPTPTPTPT